jgi:hypothetical protein
VLPLAILGTVITCGFPFLTQSRQAAKIQGVCLRTLSLRNPFGKSAICACVQYTSKKFHPNSHNMITNEAFLEGRAHQLQLWHYKTRPNQRLKIRTSDNDRTWQFLKIASMPGNGEIILQKDTQVHTRA